MGKQAQMMKEVATKYVLKINKSFNFICVFKQLFFNILGEGEDDDEQEHSPEIDEN